MRQITEDVWILTYPLRLLGLEIGRNVTLVRLRDGRVLVHSTAPFRLEDVAAIRRIGEPAWLLDGNRFHDTFATEDPAAFPGVPYLTPDTIASGTWGDEIAVLKLDGAPRVDEHVFLHRGSRTLILTDLLFRFPADLRGWQRFVVRRLMGLRKFVGMSFFFRLLIRDRAGFRATLAQMLEWDFDRVIFGHGEPLKTGGKRFVAEALAARGF